MGRPGFTDRELLDRFRECERVVTHGQLRAAGVSASTIIRRIGPTGPWQRLLPGVVLLHRGAPSRREVMLGALAYAGHEALITGVDALRAHGLRAGEEDGPVHVLVPENRSRASFGPVRVERTRRAPKALLKSGIPVAPVPRAAIDACRFLHDLDAVRAIIAECVQRRRCRIGDLQAAAMLAARQRTAPARAALAEVASGVRSVAEAKARAVIRASDLPQPLWNVTLVDDQGRAFLSPDAYWAELCAAMEIDSIAWHADPASYRRTLRRQRQLVRNGILVISFQPQEILDDPAGCLQDIAAFLETARQREAPRAVAYRLAS